MQNVNFDGLPEVAHGVVPNGHRVLGTANRVLVQATGGLQAHVDGELEERHRVPQPENCE